MCEICSSGYFVYFDILWIPTSNTINRDRIGYSWRFMMGIVIGDHHPISSTRNDWRHQQDSQSTTNVIYGFRIVLIFFGLGFGYCFLLSFLVHLPCICNSLELESVILHGICYILTWLLCILHGICYILAWLLCILHGICYIWPCSPSILHGICHVLAIQPLICKVFATF